MICLGIDPDTKNTGLALVESHDCAPVGIVYRVLHVAVASATGTTVQDRLVEMARSVNSALHVLLESMPVHRIAIEWQRLRPRGEKNPNSIVDLNGVAGMCLQAASAFLVRSQPLLTPIPADWKGQVPKDIHQKRILAKVGLTEDLEGVPGAETMTKTQKGHVIDAIGLALWASRQRVRKAG